MITTKPASAPNMNRNTQLNSAPCNETGCTSSNGAMESSQGECEITFLMVFRAIFRCFLCQYTQYRNVTTCSYLCRRSPSDTCPLAAGKRLSHFLYVSWLGEHCDKGPRCVCVEPGWRTLSLSRTLSLNYTRMTFCKHPGRFLLSLRSANCSRLLIELINTSVSDIVWSLLSVYSYFLLVIFVSRLCLQ